MFVYTVLGMSAGLCSSFLTLYWLIAGHCVLVNGDPHNDHASPFVTRKAIVGPQYPDVTTIDQQIFDSHGLLSRYPGFAYKR